jgi:L-rhamnose isomerase
MAFMYAMLEPFQTLVKFEEGGKNFERLAYLELMKSKPFGAVWDYYCMKSRVPVRQDYIEEIRKHENDVLLKR